MAVVLPPPVLRCFRGGSTTAAPTLMGGSPLRSSSGLAMGSTLERLPSFSAVEGLMKLKHVGLVCASEENADAFYGRLLGLAKSAPERCLAHWRRQSSMLTAT